MQVPRRAPSRRTSSRSSSALLYTASVQSSSETPQPTKCVTQSFAYVQLLFAFKSSAISRRSSEQTWSSKQPACVREHSSCVALSSPQSAPSHSQPDKVSQASPFQPLPSIRSHEPPPPRTS